MRPLPPAHGRTRHRPKVPQPRHAQPRAASRASAERPAGRWGATRPRLRLGGEGHGRTPGSHQPVRSRTGPVGRRRGLAAEPVASWPLGCEIAGTALRWLHRPLRGGCGGSGRSLWDDRWSLRCRRCWRCRRPYGCRSRAPPTAAAVAADHRGPPPSRWAFRPRAGHVPSGQSPRGSRPRRRRRASRPPVPALWWGRPVR